MKLQGNGITQKGLISHEYFQRHLSVEILDKCWDIVEMISGTMLKDMWLASHSKIDKDM